MLRLPKFAAVALLVAYPIVAGAAEPSDGGAGANNVAYFAIEANDLARAKQFYEAVFGWRFLQLGGADYFISPWIRGDAVYFGR